MKRDLELIRKLLFYFEEKPDDHMEECPRIEGFSELEIKYHLLLMDEANLLRCEREITESSKRVIKVYQFSLTWEGHEFLEATRNISIWNRAKSICLDKSGSLSFEVLKALLVNLAKESIGLIIT